MAEALAQDGFTVHVARLAGVPGLPAGRQA